MEDFSGHAPDPSLSRDERIDRILSEPDETYSETRNNWYITIAVSRDVEIKGEILPAQRYFWLGSDELGTQVDQFAQNVFPHFDIIAGYIAATLDSQFLEQILIDDVVYVSAPDRESFGFPRSSMTAKLSVGHSMDALDYSSLRSLLSAVAAAPQQDHRWMKSASELHLAALQEEDGWKRFFWHYTALEVLTAKLGPANYEAVADALALRPEAGPPVDDARLPLGSDFGPKERLTAVAKFALMAMALSPSTAAADIEHFKQAKRIRDQTAHRDPASVDSLVTFHTRRLFEQYVAIEARRRFLTGVASD